jgi:diaminohydroxyphosphoribosylaminopyrimidine deaminase/5-amino-6-(5-phosphoribosylamino)uracil reductase
MLDMLAQQSSVTNLLVEGGGELLGSLFDLQQIDQCEVFVAPKLVGGKSSPSPLAGLGIEDVNDGPHIDLVQHQMRGQDMHLSYRLRWK